MKKLLSAQLCALAVLAVVNIIGANLALMLRLPLYLDSIGTMAAGALFGPLWGAVTGAASALLNGVTTDPYAFYYLPVQLITGALAGIVFQKIRIVQDRQLRLPRLFPAAILVSLPGTVVSASVTAFLFGGITSSGSTILVQLLHGLGWNLTVSVCAVQALTDYVITVSRIKIKERSFFSKAAPAHGASAAFVTTSTTIPETGKRCLR